MFSCCIRPKRVKEGEEDFSFTANRKRRPIVGTPDAKYMTTLIDARGVSVVATKEILCSQKPNLLVFCVIPVHSDDRKNNNYITGVQSFVSTFTQSQARVCLYFIQIKPESSLTDTNVMKFNGLSSMEYKQQQGYSQKLPIASAVALDSLKDVSAKTSIPLNRTIFMGLGPGGCLVLNFAFSQYNLFNLAGYACVDSYLPKNFSMYSQFSQELLDKPILMSNSTSPDVVPSSWGNETFNELRYCGMKPSSSCFFSIRSKANNYWDYLLDWMKNYIEPQIDGKEVLYRRGRRVSWAPEDILEDYIEYELDSDDDYEYESESLQRLVVGF